VRVDQIEIHDGEPDTPYENVGNVRARLGARTAFSKAPSLEEANSRLREEALKIGATAVINVQYKRGAIPSSWKGLTATGTGVRLVSDEKRCPYCAETIKREAVRCRHCGSDLPAA
jgi:Zn finger protein HypA/HybF involved in hydrogenase expression